MIKYLKDLECINLERLLLLRGKELSLTDEECHILLLIDTFVTLHKKMITPSLLLKYSSLTPHEMDHILDSLLKKKWIFNKNGAICLNHFEEKLLENKEAPVEEKMNMVDIFEEQFGRPLTPMEFDSIKEWVQSGYSEEMILKALKEAVKSQVLTLRYIEGILINWAQNGVKERYIDEKPQERKVKEIPLPKGYQQMKKAIKEPAFMQKKFEVKKASSLSYDVGDTVKHIKFGTGVVKSIVDGGRDYEVTVDFDKVGTKKMFAAFAKLRKI